MVIIFNQDTEASYDGINTRTYKSGVVYTPTSPRETRVFEHYVSTGKAKNVQGIEAPKAPNLPKSKK